MQSATPSERPGFQQLQFAFAAHIRDPAQQPRPDDVEDRRMAIYRELFYNNIEGFVASGFPVLRAITPDERWHRMVRAFFAGHRCSTPYFMGIAQEFLHWLQQRDDAPADDPPFLLELAHYEWVELALQTSDADEPVAGLDRNGDPYTGRPVISPLAWHLAYAYPVQRIGPDYQPQAPDEQPTYLVVHRDRRDEVHFLQINAVTFTLLELLQQNPEWTGQDAVRRIAADLQHPQPDAVMTHGRALLSDLRERNVIIGTRN